MTPLSLPCSESRERRETCSCPRDQRLITVEIHKKYMPADENRSKVGVMTEQPGRANIWKIILYWPSS